MMSAPIQSYKKVINHPGTSRASAANIEMGMSTGVDSIAAGQTGPVDFQVPTGAVIKFFDIAFAVTNLVAVSMFMNVSIQLLRAGQVSISPIVIGGDPQRNQVFFQDFFNVGRDQNAPKHYRFKVPNRFQRVRDGDRWIFNSLGSAVHASGAQIIYKFYR